ncbi:MAG: PD-(D/E)XK nuclease family protein [Marinilabiliaceae bacterium]|nr:PD-(D/E)XK nuclease family protein [Marinilabiliaceae bacterium]
MNVNKIKDFLKSTKIPKVFDKPKTFLDIARQPHYENVLSNLYAFYLNKEEEHGFGSLFIDSLMEIIEESDLGKNIELDFSDTFSIETEYPTKSDGRIDLLIANEEHAIIIENKIYHKLINNLNDYWDSIDYSDENKIGIIVSLHPINNINHQSFINITHIDLWLRVMKNIGNHVVHANEKYLVFLKDIYQNIINLSANTMKEKDLEFYYDNCDKIKEVTQFSDAFNKYLTDEVEKAMKNLDQEFKQRKSNGLRYLSSPNNKDLVIFIDIDNLKKDDKSLSIIVELQNNAIEVCRNIEKSSFTTAELKTIDQDFFSKKKIEDNEYPFAGQWDYELCIDQIGDLSSFITNQIEEDHLLSIFEKLDNFLTSERQKK